MVFYSETKKTKYYLDIPPPKKGAGIRIGTTMATRTHVCSYLQPVTWIFTGSYSVIRCIKTTNFKVIPSSKFIFNYSRFSRPTFRHWRYFYTKETTRSFNARATHFKLYLVTLHQISILTLKWTAGFRSVDHVVHIGVDGLRPSCMRNAAHIFEKLGKEGTYTLTNARTTIQTVK